MIKINIEKALNNAEKLKQQYIEQNKLENYIKSNNVDLKKLRQQGILQDQDELDNE